MAANRRYLYDFDFQEQSLDAKALDILPIVLKDLILRMYYERKWGKVMKQLVYYVNDLYFFQDEHWRVDSDYDYDMDDTNSD